MLGLGPSLEQHELEPGDVLLSMGKGPLAITIMLLNQSRYSHAAIWTAATGDRVDPPRVVHCPLPESAARRHFVDVYRWKPNTVPPPSLDRVVEIARSYEHKPYALTDVMLMAFELVKRFPVLTREQRAG